MRVHRTGVQMESSPCEYLDSFMAEFWSTKIIVGAHGLICSTSSSCVSARSYIASFVASIAVMYPLSVLEKATAGCLLKLHDVELPPETNTQPIVDRVVSAVCRSLSRHPSRVASSHDLFLDSSPRCCVPLTCAYILFIAVMCSLLGVATYLANSPVACDFRARDSC